ncbi:MAG TPA: hypothetical protein VFX96_02185 [Pyrinomonadaceae bacterium]|nr:hypothetical protein [Pyrinomonadaceae bacterium]
MTFQVFRNRAAWASQVTGAMFLVISAFMQGRQVFWYWGRWFERAAVIAALLTLALGLIALPRWQGFVAIAIFAYAVYWMSGTVYAVP